MVDSWSTGTLGADGRRISPGAVSGGETSSYHDRRRWEIRNQVHETQVVFPGRGRKEIGWATDRRQGRELMRPTPEVGGFLVRRGPRPVGRPTSTARALEAEASLSGCPASGIRQDYLMAIAPGKKVLMAWFPPPLLVALCKVSQRKERSPTNPQLQVLKRTIPGETMFSVRNDGNRINGLRARTKNSAPCLLTAEARSFYG